MGKDGDPGGGPSQQSQQPEQQQQQPSKPVDPKMQAAKVRMLDGTTKDFYLHRGSEGDGLFALVSADLSIEERDYFSLCFYDAEGTRHWLYNDKKILRQLKGLPWEFSYEVKFYPTAPSSLNDDHARYNLFLQLRKDITSGRLPATIPTQAILGSLVAQAEFGDASESAEYEQYLRAASVAPNMNEQLMEQIKQLHKEHKGQTAAEAEINYLDTCKQLSMYGVFMFNAKDNSNQPIGIAVCATGINIYKESIRVHRFAWQSIVKISYRKNTFAIKLKAGELNDKKDVTLVYKVADYVHAKRVWKCGVEHHTFFRLIQPEDKPKGSLFRFGSARFRYHGRTQFQTKMASQMFDHPAGAVAVQRSNSARLTQSCDNVAKEKQGEMTTLAYTDNELGSREPLTSPGLSYEVNGSANKRASTTGSSGGKSKKNKKSKGTKEADSSDSTSSDEEKHMVNVSYREESGQPHMTVASYQESTALPDDVTIEYDEHGNRITRTIKTSQVKHTVQKQTFQNYVVPDENNPAVSSVLRSREQLTPLGLTGSPSAHIESTSRSVAYENSPADANQELGEFVSSKTVTTGNRTVETITYKTERDGIVETHVEHRVTIHSEDTIDHDAELSQAILDATQMNPDMTVEKIEVRQETTA